MNGEYSDRLSLFAKHRVRYLVVGAYAVMHYTEPRYTKDIDIWVDCSLPNAERIYRALAEFGAPLAAYTPKDFTGQHAGFQIGVEPVRIDVMMSLPGLTSFNAAWKNRSTSRSRGLRLHFLSRRDLIRAKRAAGRRKDLDDIDALIGRS